MAVCEILQLGNPILWTKSSVVEDISTMEMRDLVNDLDDTLKAFRELNGFGRGIAAPQIGILKRAIFIRMHADGFVGALINPEIMSADDNRIEIWDTCFSFPDLLVRVSRAVSVHVDYTDERGIRRSLEASEDLSELLQHEIDHLDGILAVERSVSPKAFSTRAEWIKMGRPK